MKTRSIILSSVFCLFLLGPMALWAAQTHLYLELPSNFTAEGSTYLSGGYEKVDLLKRFSLKGFASERFQDDLNTTVENNIPFRALVLLQNAAGLASNRQNNIATIEFPDIRANGSYARKGLMLLNESVHEPQFDLTGIQATGKKIPPIIKPEGPTLIHNDAMGSVFDFYSNWYGSSDVTANLTVTNSEPLTDTKALIAMDSFNDSLHWLIAQNHRAIQCVLDLKNDSEGPETLQERIDGANADTIYFVGNPLAYARVTSTHPQYFELS